MSTTNKQQWIFLRYIANFAVTHRRSSYYFCVSNHAVWLCILYVINRGVSIILFFEPNVALDRSSLGVYIIIITLFPPPPTTIHIGTLHNMRLVCRAHAFDVICFCVSWPALGDYWALQCNAIIYSIFLFVNTRVVFSTTLSPFRVARGRGGSNVQTLRGWLRGFASRKMNILYSVSHRISHFTASAK